MAPIETYTVVDSKGLMKFHSAIEEVSKKNGGILFQAGGDNNQGDTLGGYAVGKSDQASFGVVVGTFFIDESRAAEVVLVAPKKFINQVNKKVSIGEGIKISNKSL